MNFYGGLIRHCCDSVCAEPAEEIVCAILGINIFVAPDIDYFVVFTLRCCTGKENGANGRIGREN